MSDSPGGNRCVACKQLFSARQPAEETPCAGCRVDLEPENETPVNVYLICRNQALTAGMGGTVIDLNYPAVFGVMDRWPGGIANQWDCFMKVRKLFSEFRPTQDEGDDG